MIWAGVALWLALFLPLAGSRTWVFLSVGPWGPGAWLVLLPLAAIGATWKPLRQRFTQHALADARVSLAVAATAGLYLGLTAWQQGRQLFPYVHDESSYLIQAHQLAHGRLWYAAHPFGRSFDSFQLLARDRVYASAYFPGTALLHVPGVWLHLPPWLTDLTIAAGVIGLVHWLVSRSADQKAGHLAVILLLACPMFRTLSTMTMAQLPLLLYGLSATAAWYRWRANQRWSAALLCGLLVGLAAITRPVDTLCFAVPIGAVPLLSGPLCFRDRMRMRVRVIASEAGVSTSRNHPHPLPEGEGTGRSRPWIGLIAIIVGLIPSAIVQGLCDRGITGHWSTTPFRVYADADHPDTAYGFHRFDPQARPQSPLPQKQALYDQEYRPLIAAHQPGRIWGELVRHRLPLLLSVGGAVTPFPLLAMFWPAAWAAVRRNPLRGVLLAPLPLFLAAYVPYVFFFPDYTMVAAPALVCGVVLVVWSLQTLWWRTFAILSVTALSLAALPQLDASVRDDLFDAPLLADANRQLGTISQPALVLFRYDPDRNVHEEPVYNADAAWPDDARIVRAHALGPSADGALVRYYAERSPARVVYVYDEASRTLSRVGEASRATAAIIP